MAIQIPQVKRLAPQQDESVGRIDVKPADPSKGNALVDKAVLGVAEDYAKFEEKAAEQAADDTGRQAGVEYVSWRKSELEKINKLPGDPTTQYAEFDRKSAERQKEIAAKYEGSDWRTKERVNAKIQDYHWDTEDERKVGENNRQQNFRESIFNTELDVKRDSAFKASHLFNENDPATVAALDKHIQGIKASYNDKYREFGLVRTEEKVNEDGTVTKTDVADDIVKQEAKKGVAPAIEAIIKNFNNAGHPEKAKAIYERYKDDLPLKMQVDLANSNKSEFVAKEAAGHAATILRNFPDDPVGQIAAVDDIQGVDADVKFKIKEKLDANSRWEQAARERSGKVAGEKVFTIVDSVMDSEKPFTSIEEARTRSPEFKELYDNRLSSKQKLAVEKQIIKPAKSNEAKLDKHFEIMARPGGYAGMTRDEFRTEVAAGLNPEHTKMAFTAWKDHNTDSDTEITRRDTFAANELKKQLIGLKIIKKADGRSLSAKEIAKQNEVQLEWYKFSHTLPKNPSQEEIRKGVAKFATAYKKEELNKQFSLEAVRESKAAKKFNGGGVPPALAPNAQPKNKPIDDVNGWRAKFKEANKKAPKSMAELQEWRNKQAD